MCILPTRSALSLLWALTRLCTLKPELCQVRIFHKLEADELFTKQKSENPRGERFTFVLTFSPLRPTMVTS